MRKGDCRMRTLKYAILGAISRAPKTGYDLMLEFNEELSHTWYASHSQIYPELKRLTKEGLIEYKVEIQGECLEKKVYTITEKGLKEFQKWVLEDVDVMSSPKDEFRLKIYYLDYFDSDDVMQKLADCKEKHLKRMRKFEKALANYPKPPAERSRLGDYLVLKGSLMREQSYVDWLDLCMEMVQERDEGQAPIS